MAAPPHRASSAALPLLAPAAAAGLLLLVLSLASMRERDGFLLFCLGVSFTVDARLAPRCLLHRRRSPRTSVSPLPFIRSYERAAAATAATAAAAAAAATAAAATVAVVFAARDFGQEVDPAFRSVLGGRRFAVVVRRHPALVTTQHLKQAAPYFGERLGVPKRGNTIVRPRPERLRLGELAVRALGVSRGGGRNWVL